MSPEQQLRLLNQQYVAASLAGDVDWSRWGNELVGGHIIPATGRGQAP